MSSWLVGLALFLLLAAASFAAASCSRGVLNPSQAGALNRQKLMQLSPGMLKSEVLRIMGTAPLTVATGPVAREEIPNPYLIESFPRESGQIEVVYYFTGEAPRIPFSPLRPTTVPLVFHNGVLGGWGQSYLDSILVNR